MDVGPSVPAAPPLPTTVRSTRASEPLLPAPPSNSNGDDDPQERPPPAPSTSATTAQTPRRHRLGKESDISGPREAKPSNERADSTRAHRTMKDEPTNEQCVASVADIRLAFRHCRTLEVGLHRAHQPSPTRDRILTVRACKADFNWLVSRYQSHGSARPTARARKYNHWPARNPTAGSRSW
jgi:hypothetical protein